MIPNIVHFGASGLYPDLVDPNVSRDFIYVDDVARAFIEVGLKLSESDYGESFNLGTGRKTTIGDVVTAAQRLFDIRREPVFTMPNREWDLTDWVADISKVCERFGWEPRVGLEEGLERTASWYQSLPDKAAYLQSSKRYGLDTKHSVSAVIACYKDGQAIPIIYERLKKTFNNLNVEHEIIFVNDCSPDDSEEVIRSISRNDRRVLGISHSRNFGSQAAFRSGMEIATKNSCVLLDGDLQDPPELIEQFVSKWREGFDVVYGRRVKREASLPMQIAYKLFYRTFDTFSYIRIPHDAGDFALVDRRVMEAMLRFPERDLFLARSARLRWLSPDRCRLCAPGTHVRTHHQQSLEKSGLGQEGNPFLQLCSAGYPQQLGDHLMRDLISDGRGTVAGQTALSQPGPQGLCQCDHSHRLFRVAQCAGDQCGRRIHC